MISSLRNRHAKCAPESWLTGDESWASRSWRDQSTRLSSTTVATTATDPFQVEREVERARSEILALGPNWDGEGAMGYSVEVFERAAEFVRRHVEEAERLGAAADIPRILPGPDGGVDVRWTGPGYELLVAVSANESEPASFFGDTTGGTTVIRGHINALELNRGLVAWLARD